MREPVKKLLQLPRLFSGRTEMDLFSPRRDLTKVERERYTRKRDFFAFFQGTFYSEQQLSEQRQIIASNEPSAQGLGRKRGKLTKAVMEPGKRDGTKLGRNLNERVDQAR